MKQSNGLLNIEIVGGLKEFSTTWIGASVLIELFRKLELDQIANRVLPTKKTAPKKQFTSCVLRRPIDEN